MSNLDGLGYRGKTVVVTGGSSGMGASTARILGELGAKVYIVDIQPPSVPHEGFYKTDLSKPEDVRQTVKALSAIAPIHFVFPCAGIPPHALGPLQCMAVNYIGTRYFVEQLLPHIEEGAGIALISSDAAMSWQKNLAQNLELLAISDPDEARAWAEANPDKLRDGYTTSKEMLVVWVQHFAVELGMERRIRLNCIGPCPTATAFMKESIPVLGQDFVDNFPYPVLHRMATPDEQAWPLILLNSPLNAAVTGAFLYTDQGFVGGLSTSAIDAKSIMGG